MALSATESRGWRVVPLASCASRRAEARDAYVISDEDDRRLVAEGYQPEPCGAQVSPEKTMLFVDDARLSDIASRRQIPVGLGPDFLAASAIVLIAFEETVR